MSDFVRQSIWMVECSSHNGGHLRFAIYGSRERMRENPTERCIESGGPEGTRTVDLSIFRVFHGSDYSNYPNYFNSQTVR